MSDEGALADTGAGQAMSNLSFRGLALWLRLREMFGNPHQALLDAGLEAGQAVLDYGCGIGSYTGAAAQIVGNGGKVYALDIHPLAIEAVEKRAARAKLANVRTIVSDRETGLQSGSLDVALLFDVIHSVQDQLGLLRELHRVIREDGILLVVPDHMSDAELHKVMTGKGLFVFDSRHGEVFRFRKQG